ncbi:hypothetical protein NPIL_43731 [Nephila pilipes]|uniref:Uncharacterized protein n=1 Tax=Nephila pilipes TaxID=299642 RepID=A0A8X6NYG0_NEPPI|nr:hypothetical protein NPIL_43731 [Nephila pilipes]
MFLRSQPIYNSDFGQAERFGLDTELCIKCRVRKGNEFICTFRGSSPLLKHLISFPGKPAAVKRGKGSVITPNRTLMSVKAAGESN